MVILYIPTSGLYRLIFFWKNPHFLK